MLSRVLTVAGAVLVGISAARGAVGQQQRAKSPGVELALEGEALEKRNDFQGALRKYEQALQVFRRDHVIDGEELVLKFEATLYYRRLNELDKAAATAVQAVALSRQLGNTEEEMITRSLAGSAYMKMSRF